MTSNSDAGFWSGARLMVGFRRFAFIAFAFAAWMGAHGALAQKSSSAPLLPVMGPIGTPAERTDQVEKDRIAGVSAFERGDFATATAYFQRVRRVDSTNDEGMFLLGRAYLATGQTALAADEFTSAIALNDKVEKYFYARAKAEMRLGKFAAAVVDYNRDLELRDGKGSPIFFQARGDAYLGNGQTDLAIKDYGLVVAGGGDARLAYLHRGIALARSLDLEHALQDLNTAEAAGKSANALDFDTYFYRGIVEQLGGDKAGALRDYKAAQAFKSDHKPQAECLVILAGKQKHGLFGGGGPPKRCRGFDAVKALLLPPES